MNFLRIGILLLSLLVSLPILATDNSVVKLNAKASAEETVESLKKLIEEKRFKIFNVYDQGDKGSVKQVIAFGKASHNSRIMWHDSAAALELPLKIAVIQDDVGTQVVYRKPTALRDTYSLDSCNLLDELDVVMAELAQQAAQ